jgi:hypothetical protein
MFISLSREKDLIAVNTGFKLILMLKEIEEDSRVGLEDNNDDDN